MGQQQQQQTMESVAALRRIVVVVAVTALMALIMAVGAASAFADPNHGSKANNDSAAGRCGPPGQSVSNPELPTSGAPGPKVKQNCVPSH
jgi:hypothetical protein